jgi:hypothetical protein
MNFYISSLWKYVGSLASNIFNPIQQNDNIIKIPIQKINLFPQCVFANIIRYLNFNDIKNLCQYKFFYSKININPFIWMNLCTEYLLIDCDVIKQRFRKYENNNIFKWKELYIDLMKDMEVNSEIGYLPKYIKIFNQCGVLVSDIPIIDLGGRTGSTSYIDFIKYQDVKGPFMKFKDRVNRCGFVFRLKSSKNYYVEWLNKESSIEGTLSIFQRYVERSDYWTYGTYGCHIESVYHEAMEKGNCIYKRVPLQTSSVDDELIVNYILNQDIYFTSY